MRFYITLEKRQVVKMLKYEIKKVFSKARCKIALLFLMIVLLAVSMMTISRVEYVDENGNHTTGFGAAKTLREEKNKWAGSLTEDTLRNVYRENQAINSENGSGSIEDENRAYQKKQGISSITELINNANSPWRDYNYYAIDSITEDEAANVYEKRVSGLENWFSSGEETFSQEQQDFLLGQYKSLDTPFYFEYYDGWAALLQNISTFILMLALFIGFFVSGIFSDEFQTKADAVFFSTKLGRNRAIRVKLGAGFLIATVLYVAFLFLYTAVVLLILGADGAGCPIQLELWRDFYNATFLETYLLIAVGGYIGMLFAATIAMLISALTRSTVIAIIAPFVVLCVFPFLSRIITLPELCSFFPDRLMDIYNAVQDFSIMQIGGMVIGIPTVIILVYTIVTLILQPVVYGVYKKAEIK